MELHGLRRCYERHTDVHPESLMYAVRERRFRFVRRLTCSRSLCEADVMGKTIRFVYSRAHQCLVTVLP